MKKLAIVLFLLFIPVVVQAVPVTFTWEAPTTNADGTPITDLAGYRIYCNGTAIVDNLTVSSYATNLAPGTYACYVVAIDTSGNVSNPSNTVTQTISDTVEPSAPFNFQFNTTSGSLPVTINTAGLIDVQHVYYQCSDGTTGEIVGNEITIPSDPIYCIARAYDSLGNGSKMAMIWNTDMFINGNLVTQ